MDLDRRTSGSRAGSGPHPRTGAVVAARSSTGAANAGAANTQHDGGVWLRNVVRAPRPRGDAKARLIEAMARSPSARCARAGPRDDAGVSALPAPSLTRPAASHSWSTLWRLWPFVQRDRWWRRGQCSISSIRLAFLLDPLFSRIVASVFPDPARRSRPRAGSCRSISLPMSLYRAKEVGLPAPLGVTTPLIVERHRVHRLSPVITLPSRAKATIALIEPASASPLPSALHA